MQIPFTWTTWWFVESADPDPLVADSVLALTVLSSLTGQQPSTESLAAEAAHDRSVVVLMIPVRNRDAALTPPHDDKIDPVTIAHWLVADFIRSLRIVTDAPLPELHFH